MNRIDEELKIDVGLKPTSLATTNLTSEYYSLRGYDKALFACNIGAMAAGNTVALQAYQAADGLGTSAAVITNATCTVTANTGVAAVTITGDTVADTNTVTINGVVFTAKASSPDNDAGEFLIGATDTTAMAAFAAVVNDLLPDLYATSNAAVMTVVARDPGAAKITLTAITATRFVGATLRAAAYVEVNAGMLTSGMTHVAIKATTSGTVVVGAPILRGKGDYSPVQYVAASDVAV